MTSYGDGLARRDQVRRGVADARRTGGVAALLAGLVAIALLVVAYERHESGVGLFREDRWDMDLDGAVVEWFGYGSLLAAAALLLVLFRRRREPVHLAWAGALTVLVLDDSLQLHEFTGAWVEAHVDVDAPLGLRVVDLGELAFWAVAASIVGAVLYAGHRRSSPVARKQSARLAGLIAALVVFAVVLDMVHIAVMTVIESWRLDLVLRALESAGETAVMVGLAAYALHLTRAGGDTTSSDSTPSADGHALDEGTWPEPEAQRHSARRRSATYR